MTAEMGELTDWVLDASSYTGNSDLEKPKVWRSGFHNDSDPKWTSLLYRFVSLFPLPLSCLIEW